jgi:hypothetical protein
VAASSNRFGWAMCVGALVAACGGGGDSGGAGGAALPGGQGGGGNAGRTDAGGGAGGAGGGGPSGGQGGGGGAPSGGQGGGGAVSPADASTGGAQPGGEGGGGSVAPTDAGPETPDDGVGGAEPPLRDAGPEGPDFTGGVVIEDVRMNEVDCHGNDWVEVVNLTDADFDLSGWVLTDTLEDVAPEGHAYIVPADTVVPANGFLVLLQSDMSDGTEGFEFGISCGEEHLRLVRPNGTTADHVEVPERDGINTWGRFPDGTGDWTHTMATKGEPNEPGVDPGPILFDALTGGVPVIDLYIDPADVQRLISDPRSTVTADFDFRLDEFSDPIESMQVGLHLKGRIGSFRPITGKSGFKIDINEFAPNQRFFGLKELTLNNMVQDRSSMSQFAAYEIFRALGVCAPRVGYVWVRVNDEAYGLYANMENYDDLLFGRCFPGTSHVYEGRYGEDLRQDLVERLDVKEGNPLMRDDMHAIVDALDTPPDGDIYGSEAAQMLFDWDRIITTMAVEQYIGHWDGYAPTRNNWVMHVDDIGRLSLQPWGTDQCFGRNNDIYSGQGRLFQTCLANVACRNAYEGKFGQIMQTLDGLDLETRIRDTYAVIRPFVEIDPRSPYRVAGVDNSVNDVVNFLARRRMDLGTQFECILGANADPDGDGFRCETDCAPDDPTINPAAEDVCRDGIDQDCNGVADDDPGCPDCETIERNGHRYLACLTPRSWQDAQAHCAFFGSSLAAPDHVLEAAWLYEQAHPISNQDFWIGLNDRDFEGTFSFLGGGGSGDGPFTWVDESPDAAGEEDCVYMTAATGAFDDLNCLRQKAVLCEDLCDFNGDRDRDGLNNCSADCDDDDNTIFPGAPEICGDGIDQNCNGVADEGDNCDCFQVFRGAHSYKICGGARSANDARNACQAQGGELAIFDTAGEAAWVHAQALALTDAPLWIGLQDRFAIDEWAWVDGNPPTWLGWSPGQPSAGGVEDCAVMRGDDGMWDDQACDLAYGAICEDTCGGRRVDTDGDSYPACGNDCDDSNPGVHPGAAEICGDGVDQNCDGRVDEDCR